MPGLLVDRERAEAAVVGGSELVDRDVPRGSHQVGGHGLGSLDGRVERIDDADEGDLLHPVGVGADALTDEPVDPLLVVLAGHLDEEVPGVHAEQRGQQLGVVDLLAVHRVHVATGARVDADVPALLRGEAVDDAVVERDEGLEQVLVGPRVAGVLLARQAALGEVDRDADGARGEGLADVLLGLVAQVGEELLAAVALELAGERVEQVEHRRRDHRLLERLGGVRRGLLQQVGGVRPVAERPARQARQLPVVPVVEDREVLAVAGQVVRETGAGEGVGQRVGREARGALLAVGHDRAPGGLHALDGVPGRGVLLGAELLLGDLAPVIGGDGLLQPHRAGQRADVLGGDGHRRRSPSASRIRRTRAGTVAPWTAACRTRGGRRDRPGRSRRDPRVLAPCGGTGTVCT